MLSFVLALPLDDLLGGVKAKLARADEHMKTLDEQWRAFGKTQSYSALHEFKPETCEWNCYLSLDQPIPINLSIILGDALHNMRSCLDHLVARLVELHGGVVKKHHTFPIYSNRPAYEGSVNQPRRKGDRHGPLDGIPAEGPERALIQEAQPYHGRDGAEGHPLAVLNRMVNIDKHRAIHVATSCPQATDALDLLTWPANAELIDHASIWQPGQPLEDRTHIAWLRFSDAHPADEVSMKADLPLAIVFGNPPAKGLWLEDIFDYVSEIIGRAEILLL